MGSYAQQTLGLPATLTIANQAEELVRIASWLEAVTERFQLPERTAFKLDLVLNEALPNIISYAYQDQQNHDIVIKIEDAHDHVILEIIDDGAAFDPFAKKTFVQPNSLETSSIGGRGIHLINTFTDAQEYQRCGQTNIMRVSILKASEARKPSASPPRLMKENKSICLHKGRAEIIDPIDFVQTNSDLLASMPLCAGIPFHLIKPFLHKCEYKRLIFGDILISPGQPNHYLYLLLAGHLEIHIDSLESPRVFLVQPGEFVGEVSIIDGLAPTAYVTASTDSLVLCIHETLLWSEFFQIPGAARNLLRQIAERMRARNFAIQKSVEQAIRLEHLEKELRIAQELQVSMLPYKPLFPEYPQIEVDGLMTPAKEVGGDFYDTFPLDSERVCIAIGDVAGKGVPAALFMVRSLTVLRTEMLKTKELLPTIQALNETLSQDNPMCMFVTLMICVIDIGKEQLHYVNGGHNRPLLGNAHDGFRFLQQPKGILVGINPGAEYQVASLSLTSGDMLILYTDGVTEAMSPSQEEFTNQRLLSVVNEQKNQSAAEMVSIIQNAVIAFAATAEQSDDLTLLALRFLGSK